MKLEVLEGLDAVAHTDHEMINQFKIKVLPRIVV